MPHIIWRPKAREDAGRIVDFIADRNPAAAARKLHWMASLCDPYMHRTGRLPDTREAIITPNYILVYRIGAEAIEILAVKHTRQQYP